MTEDNRRELEDRALGRHARLKSDLMAARLRAKEVAGEMGTVAAQLSSWEPHIVAGCPTPHFSRLAQKPVLLQSGPTLASSSVRLRIEARDNSRPFARSTNQRAVRAQIENEHCDALRFSRLWLAVLKERPDEYVLAL